MLQDLYDRNLSWSTFCNATKYMIDLAAIDPLYPLVYFQGPDYTSSKYTQNTTDW